MVVQSDGGLAGGRAEHLPRERRWSGPVRSRSHSTTGSPAAATSLDPIPTTGGGAAAAEPWNNLIQPANTTVDVIFQDSVDITTNDLALGDVASASFAYIGPATVHAAAAERAA